MKILFRESLAEPNELESAQKYFDVVHNRTNCKNELVIGRYSCLPYYLELEKDLQNLNCKLINPYSEHSYIANFDWYYDVKQYTFDTYNDNNFYNAPEGAYVVKGKTNSKKMLWNKLCFALNKQDALKIASELSQDALIGQQGIIYRLYEPLETFEIGLNGLPMTNEFRFFFIGKNLIDYGYYWSIAQNEQKCDSSFIDFAKMIAKIISEYCTFFVLDIAKTIKGELRLVEVNDGQMSGLSCISPDRFYKTLSEYFVPQPDLTAIERSKRQLRTGQCFYIEDWEIIPSY